MLYTIYGIEENHARYGNYDFVPASNISEKMGIIHESLVQILRELQSDKMIILIDNDVSCFCSRQQ